MVTIYLEENHVVTMFHQEMYFNRLSTIKTYCTEVWGKGNFLNTYMATYGLDGNLRFIYGVVWHKKRDRNRYGKLLQFEAKNLISII